MEWLTSEVAASAALVIVAASAIAALGVGLRRWCCRPRDLALRVRTRGHHAETDEGWIEVTGVDAGASSASGSKHEARHPVSSEGARAFAGVAAAAASVAQQRSAGPAMQRLSASSGTVCFIGDLLEVRARVSTIRTGEFLELVRLPDSVGSGARAAVRGAALKVTSFEAEFTKARASQPLAEGERGPTDSTDASSSSVSLRSGGVELRCCLGPFSEAGRYVVQHVLRSKGTGGSRRLKRIAGEAPRDGDAAASPLPDRILLESRAIEVRAPVLHVHSAPMYRAALTVNVIASPSYHVGDALRLVPKDGTSSRSTVLLLADVVDRSDLQSMGTSGTGVEVQFSGDRAPDLPGDWDVEYVSGDDGRILSYAHVRVTGPSLTLDLARAPLWREPVVCAFETVERHDSGDYVVLGAIEEGSTEPSSKSNFQYIPNEDFVGRLEWPADSAPQTAGRYAFYYYDRAGRLLSRSAAFEVQGPSLDFDPSTPIRLGDPLAVRVRSSSHRTAYDRLVLHPLEDDSVVVCEKYVPPPAADEPTRDLVVKFELAEAPQLPGEYVVEYVPRSWAGGVCTPTAAIVMAPELSLSGAVGYWGTPVGVNVVASAHRLPGDYVSLAPEGEEPLISYSLLHAPTKCVEVTKEESTLYFEGDAAPPYPGPWQFVYILNDKTEVARSEPFVVKAPTLTASLIRREDGKADVNVASAGVEVRPACLRVAFVTSKLHDAGDKIQLARFQADPDTASTRDLYGTVPTGSSGTVTFEGSSLPNSDGVFEACYVHHGSNEVVARSNAFEIEVHPEDGSTSIKLTAAPPQVHRGTARRRLSRTRLSHAGGAQGGAGGNGTL